MSEREGGYIRLWRRLESWPLYRSLRSGEQAHVVTTLLLMANWRPSTVWLNGRRIEVGRGQILASEETIAKRAKTSRKVVRRMLTRLVQDSFVSRTGLPLGPPSGQHQGPTVTLLTICNWDAYQGDSEKKGPPKEPTEGPPLGQQRARLGPTLGPPRARSEEVEEGEEGENNNPPPAGLPSPQQVAEKRWPLTAAFRQRLAVVRGLTAPGWSWPAPENRDHLEHLLAKTSLGVAVPAAAAELDRAAADGLRVRSLGHFLAALERLSGTAANPRTGSATPAPHEAFGPGGERAID